MTHPGAKNPNWKGGMVNKVCQLCGIQYSVIPVRSNTSRFCSRRCAGIVGSKKAHEVKAASGKYNYGPKVKRLIPEPKIDGEHTRLGIASDCKHLTKKGRRWCEKCKPAKGSCDRLCVFCGEHFTAAYPSVKTKTCSSECSSRHFAKIQTGEKSHRWQGGKTAENALLRKGVEAKIWRETVFSRDNYTCVMCGERGGSLTADHIKPWALYPHIRFDPKNGRTLCRACHGYLPTTGWRFNNAMNAERKKRGGVQLGLL